MLRSTLSLALFLAIVPSCFAQSSPSRTRLIPPRVDRVPIWQIWGGVNPYSPGSPYGMEKRILDVVLEGPATPQDDHSNRRGFSSPNSAEKQNERLKAEVDRLKEMVEQQSTKERETADRESRRLRGVEKQRDQLRQENRKLKSKLAVPSKKQGGDSEKRGGETKRPSRSEKVPSRKAEVRRLTAEMKSQQKKAVDEIKVRFNKKIERLENQGAAAKEVSKMRGEMMRQIIKQIDRIGTRYQQKIETLKKEK